MFKYTSLKYLFDFSFSFLILILILPFILLVFVILLIDLNESPFFIQKRPGFKGKVFRLYKFKTMKTIFDNKGKLVSDNNRLTFFGKIIRMLSIDELPQLVNILKGEMSFIGPRPLLLEYLPLYSSKEMKRHDVIPGISGYAQVSGRNSISWKELLNSQYCQRNLQLVSDQGPIEQVFVVEYVQCLYSVGQLSSLQYHPQFFH